jgi:hypothetical protein
MRLNLGIRSFTIISRNGRHTSYTWNCLLPMALGALIFCSAILYFARVGVMEFIHSLFDPPHLHPISITDLQTDTVDSLTNLIGVKRHKSESLLPTLNVFTATGTMRQMQTALETGNPALRHEPGGTKPYMKAVFEDEDYDAYECKVCLRGKMPFHHQPHKPSLRIRLRKSDVRKGRRYVELQRPQGVLALNNWLPMQFAGPLGLLSDRTEHVRLFINRRYCGVYLRTLRPGESLAVTNGRLPGTFFKGDWAEDMWKTGDGWRRFGEESDEDLATFNRFLKVLREPPSADAIGQLYGLLDMDVYARWAALMIATVSTHTDANHNHVYYLNSNRGRLEAMPWDCLAYWEGRARAAGATRTPDFVLHPVMVMAISDPRWVHRRNRYLHQLLETVARPASIHRMIDEAVDPMLPDLLADSSLGEHDFWEAEPLIEPARQELKDYTLRRSQFLQDYLSQVRVSVQPNAKRPGWSVVEVSGNVAVVVRSVDGRPLETDSDVTATDLLYPALVEHPDDDLPLRCAQPTPMEYHVSGRPDELKFVNAITDEPVTAVRTASGGADPKQPRPVVVTASPEHPGVRGDVRSIHPSLFAAPETGDVVLGPGEIIVEQSIVTNEGQRLIVNAGTRLFLGENIGIYSRGQMLAEGTPEKPIEVMPAGNKPWGAVGVSGHESRGSRFANVHVSGGSIGTDGSIRYKGMFNVYNCPDVVIAQCGFSESHRGDDAVNLAESHIEVTHCRFGDAPADALDLDMCTGSVRQCRFEDCGNDGIDLMNCRVEVEGCRFIGCRDKGISVGEDTQVRVIDCRIRNCKIGLETKDASRALVVESLFDGNDLAVHSYQKKWLYGWGGSTALVRSTLQGSRQADLSIKKRSDAVLVETKVATIADGIHRVKTRDELSAAWFPALAEVE